jgi:putative aldouronate transport system permease protein
MIRQTTGEKIFNVFNTIFLSLLGLTTLFPFYITVVNSMATPEDFIFKNIILWPSKFDFSYYRFVLGTGSEFIRAFRVTVFITVAGTFISMFFTTISAFTLAQKKLPFRNQITFIMVFTMFFGGGMIPTYLLVRALGLINTYAAIILNSFVGTMSIFYLRNFIMNLPAELSESAIIDGCTEFKLLMKIILPLSLPAIASFTLFYAVGYWNTFNSAVLYITDYKKLPLQVYLRQILYDASVSGDRRELEKMLESGFEPPADALKATVIICATTPILLVYPFLQKYFVKGLMVGSLKG